MVAVVGDHMWAAKKGLDALRIDWNEGRTPRSVRKTSGDAFARGQRKGRRGRQTEGDIAKGLGTGEKLEASYRMPFLAHATMEPLNCHGALKPDGCEIWTGTQIARRAQSKRRRSAGPSRRQNGDPQPPARRRLWPQARARHGGRGSGEPAYCVVGRNDAETPYVPGVRMSGRAIVATPLAFVVPAREIPPAATTTAWLPSGVVPALSVTVNVASSV